MEDSISKELRDKAILYCIGETKQKEALMVENKHSNDFSAYSELEDRLLEYINKLQSFEDSQKKQLKKELLMMMKERYELNPNNIEEHRRFQIQIGVLFVQYITSEFDCSEELITFSQTGNSIKEEKEIKNFFFYLQKIKESNLSIFIKDCLRLNYSVPQFLLVDYSKVIKERLIITWRMNYNKQYDYQKTKMEKRPEYVFLYKQYSDFFDDKVNIFDEKLITKEESVLMFEALFYSNGDYLRQDRNAGVFLINTRRYLDLMHFDRSEHSSLVSDCVDTLKASTKEQIDVKLNGVFSQLYACIGGIEEGKLNEKLLFVVFCFSCVLNGVIYAEIDQNIKAAFASSLKCSAKEKVFLRNFLSQYDSFIKSKATTCVYYNLLMENEVLSALIKSYTKVLYDEDNRIKVNLSYEKTMRLIEKSGLRKTGTEDDEQEYLFSPLNEMERDQFTHLFDQFREVIHESDKDREKSNKKSVGLLSKITTVGSSMIQLHKPMMKNREKKILLPINPLRVSNHICICISGVFMNEDLSLIDSNLWYNIIPKDRSVDFYVYNWQNEDNISLGNGNVVTSMLSFVKNTALMQSPQENIVKDNKKMSKKFGKLLAYLITSRAVFRFHTISLMGLSLGCNVIKHCLKELKKLNQHIEVFDILQDVIFMGGATVFKPKHKELFELVSGTVYNFFSQTDLILSEYYSKQSVGNNELNFSQETDQSHQPRYFNSDLTNHQYRQSTYCLNLNKLIHIIK